MFNFIFQGATWEGRWQVLRCDKKKGSAAARASFAQIMYANFNCQIKKTFKMSIMYIYMSNI